MRVGVEVSVLPVVHVVAGREHEQDRDNARRHRDEHYRNLSAVERASGGPGRALVYVASLRSSNYINFSRCNSNG